MEREGSDKEDTQGQKVVLDTNIFISSIFWRGDSYNIVKKAHYNEILVFITKDIINEMGRVLSRDFYLGEQEINDVINAVVLFSHLIETRERIKVVEEDPEDNKILECAVSSGARFIVTQDKHLLGLREFRGIRIITPSDFSERFIYN
jgi:putative PIN family toxin of toxin-antitoxin system